jgi:prepilin-type N-terminal cleavage/methylation domain-containing protein
MKKQQGVTFIELITVVAILGIFISFAIAYFKSAEVDCRDPSQRPGFIARAYEANAIGDLGVLHLAIGRFELNNGRYPDSLDELHGKYGVTDEILTDRWGEKYEIYPVWNAKDMGKVRKYKSQHPVNRAFDLYSKGPDRRTATPFTSTPGCDDIVMAGDGAYFGYAYRYYSGNSGKGNN